MALGGTLIQDIPSQRPEAAGENHRDNEHRYAPDHPARVLPGTLLHSLMGRDELLTNSVHHQAVDTPAPGMRVCALSPAGIVEGIELRTDVSFWGCSGTRSCGRRGGTDATPFHRAGAGKPGFQVPPLRFPEFAGRPRRGGLFSLG